MGFRDDFVWGAATSSYQIEGAYKEDVALMKEMGLKAYRFPLTGSGFFQREPGE